MCTHTQLRAGKIKELAATASVMATARNITTPAPKPIPFGATEAQIACAQGYQSVYQLDLVLCLTIEDEKTREICINSAYAEYCRNFDSCFPA